MQTIGERLEEARKKKGISIREAAEATKIRGDYLQKFESNHFDIGLTEIYTRGFLRTYANFLKVPADRLLNDYAALGRGEARPRSPNREVYGRMDITVATAGESSDRAAPPGEEPATPEAPRPQPRFPRGASSLPLGPDPALIFKYVKWAVIAVVVVFLLLMAKSFLFRGADGKTAEKTGGQVTMQPTSSGSMLTLTATNNLYLKVARVNTDGTDGEVLFEGNLARNQSRSVPRAGDLFVTADPSENLKMESNGKVFGMGPGNGRERKRLPAP